MGYYNITKCCGKVTTKDKCPVCETTNQIDLANTNVNINKTEVTLRDKSHQFTFKCNNCGNCCKSSQPMLNPMIFLFSLKNSISL